MFYDRFVFLCARKGVSPSRAAIEAGLSKSIVTKWKGSDSDLSGAVIKKLSDYFGISKSELLEEDIEKDLPAQSRGASEEEIKFALFGGAPATDAQYEEVKRFARYVKERDAEDGK